MGTDNPRRSERTRSPIKRFQFPSSHRTNATLITESSERLRVRLAVRKSRATGDDITVEGNWHEWQC